MGREFELKYAATPEILEKLLGDLESVTEISMETTYYDTLDKDLSARHMTLRRRYENGVSVCTLKAPDGANSRKEYETEAAAIEEAIPVLCKLSNWQDLEEIAAKGLIPVCGARFTRKTALVTLGTAVVELALDCGVLLGGGREVPLCEVEVELKSGSEAAATSFANVMAGAYGLRPEPKSKFARAMSLTE